MACEMTEDVCKRINQELDEWLVCNANGTIVLLDMSDEDVDKCTVNLLIGSEYEFKLHVPSGYPHHEDQFFIESASVIQEWALTVNEYLQKVQNQVSLCNVLDKAVELFEARNSADYDHISENESDEDGESDIENYYLNADVLSDDESLMTEWELEVARKKIKWSKREPVVRKIMKRKRLQQGIDAQNETQQIFTSNEALSILTADLVKIMEDEETLGFSAEPIQDNIYNWCIRMSKFDSECDLSKDLKEIKNLFGYDYIELELTFEIDLFPFYPPLLKVIRPRLQGCMMLRLTNIELLQLSYWSPARDMKSVLVEIKEFLQQWGRIAIDCDRNQLSRCPYLDIEHQLLTLAQVCEVVPRSNRVYKLDDNKMRGLRSAAWSQCPSGRQAGDKEEHWEKGVGFGHNKRPGWDFGAYLAAQKEKDNKIESVLKEILNELKALPSLQSSASNSSPSQTDGCGAVPSSSPKKASSSNSGSDVDMNAGKQAVVVSDVYAVIEGSALVPFLENYLNVASFLDICRHSVVYMVIVNVIRELAYRKELMSLLCCLPGQDKSIYQLLKNLDKMASVMLKKIHKPANGVLPDNCMQGDSSSDSSDTEDKSDGKCLNSLLRKKWNTQTTNPASGFRGGAGSHSSIEEIFAREFIVLFELVSHSLKTEGLLNLCQNNSHQSCEIASASISVSQQASEKAYNDLAICYKEVMKPLQLQSSKIYVGGKHSHLYSSHLSTTPIPCIPQVIRVTEDYASLSSSLPLELSSSIFVRKDHKRISIMQALITGPEGTPYSSGCYLFDIHFPPTYPLSPPNIKLKTTGNGSVRFNPNFLNCGTVCLSLLGTWHGQGGEQWNEKSSTLLQVLVSIQSLIFVPDPFFNEPGNEELINTVPAHVKSEEYNKSIRIHNINHAMVSQMQNPPPGFGEVIKTHFYLKKDLILQEVRDWMKENETSKMKLAVSQLETELNKLQPPASLLKTSPVKGGESEV